MKIIVNPGQSLLDIALAQYGSAEGIIQLLQDNPTLDATSKLAAGMKININGAVINASIRQKLQLIGHVATASKESLGGDFNNDFNNDFN